MIKLMSLVVGTMNMKGIIIPGRPMRDLPEAESWILLAQNDKETDITS